MLAIWRWSASGSTETGRGMAVQEACVGAAGQEILMPEHAHQQLPIGAQPVDLGPGQCCSQAASCLRPAWCVSDHLGE